MANIIGQTEYRGRTYQTVNEDPKSGAGTPGNIGDRVAIDTEETITIYVKVGPEDTKWVMTGPIQKTY